MVIDNLIDLLRTICSEVIRQGSLAPNAEYPDRFFTYWNHDTADHKHYDNATHGYTWAVDVNYYGKDPDEVYSMLEAARIALLQAGWKINGKGHDVASDTTTHTGRGFTAIYLEL